MQNLEKLFTKTEWSLIQEVLKTNRRYSNGETIKWVTLANQFNIKVGFSAKQRRTGANDVWRKFLRKKEEAQTVSKILIYDIETARLQADVWWSGQQFVNGNQIISDPKIITIAWKWFGSSKVQYLKWSKEQSDKKLITKFLKEYNKADMVIGYNNDKFDNRWVNARALKYNLNVNTFVKSFDIMKQSKRLFRLPSYSMNYLAKYLGVETKLQHTGLAMWEAIQTGKKKEAKKAMKLMVKYNIQDIIVTEQVYLRVRKYMKSPIHLGVLEGESKITCPTCGGNNVKLHKTTVTTVGTIQRIMKCKGDRCTYKVSNSEYLKSKN